MKKRISLHQYSSDFLPEWVIERRICGLWWPYKWTTYDYMGNDQDKELIKFPTYKTAEHFFHNPHEYVQYLMTGRMPTIGELTQDSNLPPNDKLTKCIEPTKIGKIGNFSEIGSEDELLETLL